MADKPLPNFFAHAHSATFRKRKLTQINQAITVTDIIAFPTRDSGEWEIPIPKDFVDMLVQKKRHHNLYKDQQKTLKRIIDHIDLFATYANIYHEETNFLTDEKLQKVLKNGAENAVTRLIFPEFSFYTAELPLFLQELHTLIAAIEKLAQEKNGNLHLVLSSFPVVDERKQVRNQLIYVQCGIHPTIQLHTKVYRSDLDYLDTEDVAHSHNVPFKGAVFSQLSSSTANPSIDYNSVLRCETLSGAQFWSAIDICLDHSYAVAKLRFRSEIDLCMRANNHELIPLQVSHIVTSASVDIQPENAITSYVVRADLNARAQPGMRFSENIVNRMKALDCYKYYSALRIENGNNFIMVYHPPFGSDVTLRVFPAYMLETLEKHLKTKVDAHNQLVLHKPR